MRLRVSVAAIALCALLGACTAAPGGTESALPGTESEAEAPAHETTEAEEMKIRVIAGGKSFQAVLNGGEAARELYSRLPLTLDMSELNGNEKYFYLDSPLPREAQRVGRINAGDIMLFGADCLVLFYESFSTGYSYTPLGRIQDAGGLAKALGGGGARVTFEAAD